MIRSMPGIEDRKPSDLMDSMLALCPTGHSVSPLFWNEIYEECQQLFVDISTPLPMRILVLQHIKLTQFGPHIIHRSQISKDDINLSTEELACNTVNHRLKKKYYSESSRYKNYHSFLTSGFCFYCQKMERKLGIAQILVLIHQIRGTVGHVGEDKLKLFFLPVQKQEHHR